MKSIQLKSPLKLVDFYVIEFTLKSIEKNENFDPKWSEIPFSIDFDILRADNRTNEFQIALHFRTNVPKGESGYQIKLKTETMFKLENFSKMDEERVAQYIYYTALPIAINRTRAYLGNATLNGLFDEYNFPLVDLNALINQNNNE